MMTKEFNYKTISRSIAITFMFLIFCCDKSATMSNDQNEVKEYSILFIGSSYFNHDNIPEMVKNLALASDKTVTIESIMPSGLYLSNHAQSQSTENLINSKNWDFVVLQGVGRLTAYPEIYKENSVYDALVELKQKIANNSDKTEIFFCMPWAYEDGMLWADWTDDYFAMQLKIYEHTIAYADEIGFWIAPVGWTWNSIMAEVPPLHYLYSTDYNHPSLKGSYLSACAIYSSIFQETCEGNSYTANIAEALHFQEVASEIVLNDLDLWSLK